MPLKDIKEFNIWDNDRVVTPRNYVVPRKKHKYLKENVQKIKVKDKEQEFWTQKTGYHWRTCRRCGEYVKGECWKCHSVPNTNYNAESKRFVVNTPNNQRYMIRSSKGKLYRRNISNSNSYEQVKSLGRNIGGGIRNLPYFRKKSEKLAFIMKKVPKEDREPGLLASKKKYNKWLQRQYLHDEEMQKKVWNGEKV